MRLLRSVAGFAFRLTSAVQSFEAFGQFTLQIGCQLLFKFDVELVITLGRTLPDEP